MKNCFMASNGEQIAFQNGFFDQKKDWPHGITNFHDFVQMCFVEEEYPKENVGFFFSKIVLAQYFLDVMEETFGEVPRWRRMLDIGTGPGVKIRLLKLLKYVDEVWGVDVLDREADYPDELSVQHLKNIFTAVDGRYGEDLKVISTWVNNMAGLYTGNPLPLEILEADPKTLNYDRFSFDRYIVSDFINDSTDYPGFDLITAFLCIDHLHVPSLFDKVDKLLESGGCFFFNVTNWYDIFGGAMQLPMDSPWLHARVSKDDLVRYYREHRPEIYEDAQKAIYMKSSHMTFKDFIREGKARGFIYRGHRRRIDNDIMTQAFYMAHKDLRSVYIPQSQKINPNVSIKDLVTKNITMVFTKP